MSEAQYKLKIDNLVDMMLTDKLAFTKAAIGRYLNCNYRDSAFFYSEIEDQVKKVEIPKLKLSGSMKLRLNDIVEEGKYYASCTERSCKALANRGLVEWTLPGGWFFAINGDWTLTPKGKVIMKIKGQF